MAWGDYDSDGDLDLAVGNDGQPNQLYRNDKGILNPVPVWTPVVTDNTRSVAWGDYDSDGDLDLAVGNNGQPNRLYHNDNGTLNPTPVWSSLVTDNTHSVVWGDYDRDGYLDLAIGNYSQPNRLYHNDGTLNLTPVWTSAVTDNTLSVAWGDYDNDGYLDLAVGNDGQPNRLYHNRGRMSVPSVNSPPYVTISRPGKTAAADFFSTSEILQAADISITYKLFDPEGDIVPKIFPEFSPNGGGQWFPATSGLGGDGLTSLTASPQGTPHTFIWHAEDDLIKSDNVMFRIKAQPNYMHSPILWPATDGKSPPFRVSAPWYIKVVDENGNAMMNTTVYSAGQSLGVTSQAGLLNPNLLADGASLIALAEQAKQSTVRTAHDEWAYHTYLTSQPIVITGSGEQRLVVRRDRSLILFNLVVSIEWDATDAYMTEISRAVRSASTYLYDLTDGQMAFGRVNIYDNGNYWADADLQISTKNIVRPHAYIGGLTAADKSHVIRVGRFWDGDSGNQGAWDQPEGYRTLAHEFGHYALYLYDEYFAYDIVNDILVGEIPTTCTGPENRNLANDEVNASVMDYQYTSSELSARGVPGLWSEACETTAQWQLTGGESAWETIARKYADSMTPARWQITTPLSRGLLAGPSALPADLPDWPLVEIHQAGLSASPRQLIVYHPNGGGYWGAIVALYKQDGRVIGQGFTNGDGRLDVYGAIEGDRLRVSSFDGGLAGSIIIGPEISLNLTLNPVTGLGIQAASSPPHLRVVAEPSQDPDQIDLLVFLHNFGSGADPNLIVTEPGSEQGHAPHLNYSQSTDTYEGEISFSATARGMGSLRAVGEVGGSLVRLHTTYRLQQVVNNGGQHIFANDGNLSLHLEPGSLPGAESYLVVMPTQSRLPGR